MVRRLCLVLSLACAAWAAVPVPKEHFGFTPGDDLKLADYSQLLSYFQKLEKASDRIRLVEFGRSSLGKPMVVAFLSSPENLKKLDRYREISRRLALGQADKAEARRLVEEGRAIVWIDSGLHASEVAPAQQAPELAYRMLTAEDEETRSIRENVILMQAPCINPDGLDWVVEWYRSNLGTAYETAPLPRVYQKYAGHDNNRDYFMLNLPETRHVTRMLFQEWFPQIVYNQHQAPAFPARIFMPPYAEPLNPNIPPAVIDGINLIGSAMRERFNRENKPGVLSYFGFDAWWNGGLRSVPAFHNMHGILTETAGNTYANPRTYQDLPERFGNGIPTREPSVFYDRPWPGGKWTLRDAIEYMLTADWAILELAASRRTHFLAKAYEMAVAQRDAGAKGKPYAYIVPEDQWDRSAALEMLRRLAMAAIEVRRAKSAFDAAGKNYPAGTWVLPAAQPFRGYLIDLLEPQKYPELRSGVTGPTKRPYDIAGWTLRMQMGVAVDRIDEPFRGELEAVNDVPLPAPSLDHHDTASFLKTAELLEANQRVGWGSDGRIFTGTVTDIAYELAKPRVAVYEPWTANIDTGWTEWVFDTFHVPYTIVHNADLQKSDLRSRFDTIVIASQTAASILHGSSGGGGRARPDSPRSVQRPEYSGGIEVSGLYQVDQFVRAGGTLIALDNATELPLQNFSLPLRGLLRPSGEPGEQNEPSISAYYCPGSVLRITVDNTQPVAFGMPKEAYALSTGGQAFEISGGEGRVKSIARYASTNLLASGWLSGEKTVLGKHILVEAEHGNGRVVMFGFRPQFRGQPWSTFKLLLNTVYLGSAKKL